MYNAFILSTVRGSGLRRPIANKFVYVPVRPSLAGHQDGGPVIASVELKMKRILKKLSLDGEILFHLHCFIKKNYLDRNVGQSKIKY